jgi:transposase
MKINLAKEEKTQLELRHQVERDGRIRDRIKSVLLRDEGWSISKIAQALRISSDTVGRYVCDYLENKDITFNHQGSCEKLSAKQSEELVAHLGERLYTKACDIALYIKEVYGIDYTIAGITDWLKRHDFSYKLTKGQPAKADAVAQREFVGVYEQLKQETPEKEPILFIDAVHPTIATKPARGWIGKGIEKIVLTTASRTRMNIVGAIELSTMTVIHEEFETVNAVAIMRLCDKIKAHYSDAMSVHIILDRAGYHRSEELADYAKQHNIVLHFLPAYSPNLNPIERLWKVMNEQVRNNYFFKTAKEFRERLRGFFTRLPDMKELLYSRINDNFHIADAAK